MGFYRKKPVIIEAIQWTGENIDELKQFTHSNAEIRYYYSKGNQVALSYEIPTDVDNYSVQLTIRTLEGNMEALINDYIIKGVNGEFYPCKPDIFEKTYEEVKK